MEDKINVDEVMDTIFESQSLEIVREALEFSNESQEPRTIKIIVQGGLVEDVKGLRENESYEIEDLDMKKWS